MKEKIELWKESYKLNNLQLVGYSGGYPIIQFDKEDGMAVLKMPENRINKVIRSAETYGGIELGVGYNLRKTAFIRVNDETIVMCGHELVIERMLEKLI